MAFDAKSARKKNLALLAKLKLPVTQSLPLGNPKPKLRPVEEIARRLLALDCLFSWVARGKVPGTTLREHAKDLGLVDWMAPDERKIWKQKRADAHEEHVDSIGWRLENMWALAWVLGFDPAPSADGKMIDDAVIGPLVTEFCPAVADAPPKLRRLDEVATLEDRFYCAHNAARNITHSGSAAPKGWIPVASGGVIHERRHSLTWCLSPEVDWDDTDLST